METPAQALKLVLFKSVAQLSEMVLKDTLSYNPGYKAGDVIHLVRPSAQQCDAVNRRFVVLHAKHVIMTIDPTANRNEHLLLIEVAELTDTEHPDWQLPLNLTMN